MTRPRLLDLFCGAGGAAMGYHRAGFDVVGVDIMPQPRYPFEIWQADAFDVLAVADVYDFDAIHASPVCLGYANVTAWRGNPASHPRQLGPVIEQLERIGIPWVVENVPEALRAWDYVLCGSQFGLKVKRHRGFKRGVWSGFDLMPPCQHRGLAPFMHKQEHAYAAAMGCDWMTNREARQAIPPAYTEYIGRQLLDHLSSEQATHAAG